MKSRLAWTKVAVVCMEKELINDSSVQLGVPDLKWRLSHLQRSLWLVDETSQSERNEADPSPGKKNLKNTQKTL